MQNNLTFIETLTIEQFKNKELVDTIKVKQSPKSGKLFFSYGTKTGAVSLKGVPEHPMISLVASPETGEQFYLLHNEGNGAPVVATF